MADLSKLTKAETEVLNLLTEDFLTVKQIAYRRKTSDKAVYKILRSLKKKGAYDVGLKKVEKIDGTFQPYINQIRLHGEQYIIKPIYQSIQYKKAIGKSIIIDGNTVRVHTESVVIYSNSSFFGNNTTEATRKSVRYWNKFISRLEHELKAILIKPRSQNISRVKAEYAQIKNGLAKKCHREAEKIKIGADEDGKLWFEIDNSFNLHEAETKHPRTSEKDMQTTIEPFFNDLRDKKNYLPSDIKEMLDKLTFVSSNMVEYSEKTNQNIAWLAENIKTHGPAWLGMEKQAGNIGKEIQELSQKIPFHKTLNHFSFQIPPIFSYRICSTRNICTVIFWWSVFSC